MGFKRLIYKHVLMKNLKNSKSNFEISQRHIQELTKDALNNARGSYNVSFY